MVFDLYRTSQYCLEFPVNLQRSSCNFEKNKIYGLIGDNGVGKTSLLKLLIGVFSDNTSGNIEYDGIDIKQFNMYEMRNKYIAMLPQNIYFYNLRLREIFSCYSENIVKKIEYTIDYYNIAPLYFNENFNIYQLLERRICDFSGGEKQKILFLCVLLKKAKLYIFDEPSAGLDNSSVELLKNCICKIAKQSIVIIVTHDENLCSMHLS